MQPQSIHFQKRIEIALNDSVLQKNMQSSQDMFVLKRRKAWQKFNHFQSYRSIASELRLQVLENLDDWLVKFEKKATENGAEVHWASDSEQASKIIADICRQQQAKKVIKSKSMVTEEISLNTELEDNNIEVIESDLGEYILQLAKEPPSHIVAPMVHMNRQQVSKLFAEHHHSEPKTDISELTLEAREQLRKHFLTADVGITGANFLLAESGSALVVENEGNARLTMTLPKTRIVITGIEKVIPNLKAASILLNLLPRSATGQAISNYVSLTQQPHSEEDPEGPKKLIFILLDGGRSNLLAEDKEMLKCIRCGACMNHCPVYQNIGGHAYGWVYPGPMGSILTPYYIGLKNAKELPYSATMCGACDEVCPVKIPITKLLRNLREKVVNEYGGKPIEKISLKGWELVTRFPLLYRWTTWWSFKFLKLMANKNGNIKKIPLNPWTKERDFAIDNQEKTTFLHQIAKQSK